MSKGELSILVADDQEVVREFFTRAFGSLGFTCDLAVDGKDCLARMSAKTYDIVFLDLIMPSIDGEAALRQIKEQFPATQVVIVSIQDDEAAIQELLELGATAYLTKPFTLEGLREIMSRLGQSAMG